MFILSLNFWYRFHLTSNHWAVRQYRPLQGCVTTLHFNGFVCKYLEWNLSLPQDLIELRISLIKYVIYASKDWPLWKLWFPIWNLISNQVKLKLLIICTSRVQLSTIIHKLQQHISIYKGIFAVRTKDLIKRKPLTMFYDDQNIQTSRFFDISVQFMNTYSVRWYITCLLNSGIMTGYLEKVKLLRSQQD